ncbi:serine O-acetyltransferase [Amphibacillus marinus]|uniref:Serine acetyltransferase n=1 Tax=Amphibacillus marinus TaxID=872970 RepID=A0A1H8N7E3_9BACI|nr:hypothetical protein [Amphibacillus marinus]SEO25504.1 serine O-acetyltransferase [Amphibacillus marinus]
MKLFKIINQEIRTNKKINITKKFYILLTTPSKQVIVLYRWAKCFHNNGHKKISTLLLNKIIKDFGSYISVKSQIGIDVSFRHVNGVVIGEGVKIGNRVTIYQQVTLGGRNLGDSAKGNYPIVNDGVTIFAGAKIIGPITIGENSVVGANSVVNRDVPANTVVAGIPAKIINRINKK